MSACHRYGGIFSKSIYCFSAFIARVLGVSDLNMFLIFLVAKPNINYSTRSIYLKVKNYSKPIYVSKNKLFFKINNLAR